VGLWLTGSGLIVGLVLFAELKSDFCLDDSFFPSTASPEQTELEELFHSTFITLFPL
jgi:hypothetical protein